MGREMATIRRYVTPLAIVAAAIVLYIEAPWSSFGLGGIAPSKDVETILSVIFWVLAIVVAVALFEDRKAPGATVVEVEGPAFTRFLFSNTRAGLLWLPIRLFVGFSFLEAGLHKLFPAGKAIGAGWLGRTTAGRGARDARLDHEDQHQHRIGEGAAEARRRGSRGRAQDRGIPRGERSVQTWRGSAQGRGYRRRHVRA